MVICIVGPTGVGKTNLSIELAKKFNGEIINADSTQVFKSLDIATAKITKEEMEGIPHHLIDIKEVTDNFTVYNYQESCRNAIKDILLRGKNPIIVGGTGLYIKAALYDYKFDKEIKTFDYSKYTDNELFLMLPEKDKLKIHQNNRKRIIRALDYYKNNKTSISEKERATKILYDTVFIGLTTDRKILYERINKRVDNMIENGLIDEARNLYGLTTKSVLTPIGYKELFLYFDKQISLDEAIQLIKKRSRHYAKRQYTWFNNQLEINWFNVDFNNFSNTVNEVTNYIKKVNK